MARCSQSSCQNALPYELQGEVIRHLPVRKAQLAGSAVQLSSRGAAERVCRRWRKIALQHLPSSLTIDLCALHTDGNDEYEVADLFDELLPHIAARRLTACSIQGCTAVLSPGLPARLARAIFPGLRS